MNEPGRTALEVPVHETGPPWRSLMHETGLTILEVPHG